MTKTDINAILKGPEWTMEDAYGDIGSVRYEESLREAAAAAERLAQLGECPEEDIQERLGIYSNAWERISSLTSFVKCLGAKNVEDGRVSAAKGRLTEVSAQLDAAAGKLFAAIASLAADSPLWNERPLSDWSFVLRERMHDWKSKLSLSDREWLEHFEVRCFTPMGDLFKEFQKGVDFTARRSDGTEERIRAAKLVAVIKGAPDRVLRDSVHAGLVKSYGERKGLYAGRLNELHGFRLTAFERAGTTPLAVSLAQNRMSEGALKAMRQAILSEIDLVRESVLLRAPFFGSEKLAVFDLMAPAPEKDSQVPQLIPYRDGIGIVKKALGTVDPAMADFIDMMLEKHWIDAVVSDNKIGGAFYSRMNEFRMPRVFTSYMGTLTTVLQQGHELGHAYHYWVMRDMPAILTEFPMTLTETASTFNEALIRRYLLARADDREAFGMLWQELRSAANFLMNTMVRMEFELKFLEERRSGLVSADLCIELMREAWREWYGDTTDEADDYLWAYKLHYYKTDQLIYNYPYTVGYLLSQGLLTELDRRGDDFMPFYKAMLRDTGRMTVDEIIGTHFKQNAEDPGFWRGCMKGALASIRRFSELTQQNKL